MTAVDLSRLVAPLVWEQCKSTLPREVWEAKSIFGRYVAWPNGMWNRHGYYSVDGDVGNLQDAQDGANADIVRLVTSIIDPDALAALLAEAEQRGREAERDVIAAIRARGQQEGEE
jgi:hypothetical protein